jgi:ubiquinone/menaquinone biosynthesis C-methylase UbiE
MVDIIGKLVQAYFDYAYNRVYDFTTGRLRTYRRLQEMCINKLEFKDADRILCVGVGTGNEITLILERKKDVSIVGVDYSRSALRRAYTKCWRGDQRVELLAMDAHHLEFPSGSFDAVVCIHLMDFVRDAKLVTGEILRVLRSGARYVITYPSKKEGPALGVSLLRDHMSGHSDSGQLSIGTVLKSLPQMAAASVYLPLLIRPGKRFYSRRELASMLAELNAECFQIDEMSVYQDFVVHGRT